MEYTAKAKIGGVLNSRDARQMGKRFAEGNLSGMGQNNSSMKVVDQHSNIMSTAEVHKKAEQQRKIAEALVAGIDGKKQSYGSVWNRQTGEFSKALRIGQRSKAKHQIHSLAAQALELRRREQLAGQLPAKRKRHARHKYGF